MAPSHLLRNVGFSKSLCSEHPHVSYIVQKSDRSAQTLKPVSSVFAGLTVHDNCILYFIDFIQRSTSERIGQNVQDFVKWRGALFHKFTLALVDTSASVRQLAEYLLTNTLALKVHTPTRPLTVIHCFGLITQTLTKADSYV